MLNIFEEIKILSNTDNGKHKIIERCGKLNIGP